MGKGLSPQQKEILKYLHQLSPHMDLTQNDLLNGCYSYDAEMGKHDQQVAADNAVDSASLSRSLKRLERRGLIAKDGNQVEITDKGISEIGAAE